MSSNPPPSYSFKELPKSPQSFSVHSKEKNLQANLSMNISDEVTPLVMPHAIQKSNKDPNQGLYPASRLKPSLLRNSMFSSASEISKANRLNASAVQSESSRSNRLNNISDSLSSNKGKSIRNKFLINKLSSDEQVVQFNLKKTGKKRKFSGDNSSCNTLQKYFKPSCKYKSSKMQLLENQRKKVSSRNCQPTEVPGCEKKIDENVFEDAKDSKSKVVYHAASEGHNACNEMVKCPRDVASDTKSVSPAETRSNCFGLFGSVDDPESEHSLSLCYFEHLPLDVIEQILCQVPFQDLMNLRFVCKDWNKVISNEKFAEWKKKYYYLKLAYGPSTQELVNKLPSELFECNVDDCFLVLIRYMNSMFSRKTSCEMMDLLKFFPKYHDAISVIYERLPDFKSKVLKPWSVIAVMVLVSETAWDITLILKCLCYNGSPFLFHDVIDALYCIATFLLFFKNKLHINHGIHYRLYYALYQWENSISQEVGSMHGVVPESGIAGQQSIHTYCKPVDQKLTYEQIRILNHRLEPNQILKIVAYAGTGKTSTLIHFSRLYPQLKFLNVVFNKSMSEYASKCFPPNVECRTTHSLAFQAIGKTVKHKLTFKLKPYDISSILNKPKEMGNMNIYTYGKCVLDTIGSFVMSADEFITVAHVPLYSTVTRSSSSANGRQQRLTDQERLHFREEAESLWQKMTNPDDWCRITHDTYLKMFQLSKPKFQEYNCIMIDEAQDCNAAMLDIMLSQDVPIILVGDPHQQIYGFRGANNALDKVLPTHIYPLTKSFRFGPEIAYAASCCLEVLKLQQHTTLVGCEKESFINGYVRGQYAVIARTNFRLFEEAVRLCCTDVRRNNEPENIHAAFAGGINGYGFDQIMDIYKLASGEKPENIKDRFVKKFKSFQDLVSYAKNAEDSDLLGKVDLVTQYGHKIIDYIQTIKRKGRCAIELANVVFTTAHKAKGLEFDTVCLASDYNVDENMQNRLTESGLTEEYNILYVALTRAKQCLLMSDTLFKVFQAANEKFEYPVSSKELLSYSASLKCVKCSANFTPLTVLITVRRPLKLANGRTFQGGPLCMKCRTVPFYRPEVNRYPAVMLLDRVPDYGHRSMSSMVGPLPSDPAIKYDDGDLDLFEREVQPFVYNIVL